MGLYLSIHAARPGQDLERDNFLVFNAPSPGGGLHSSFVAAIFGDSSTSWPHWLKACYSPVTGGPVRKEHFFASEVILRDLDRKSAEMLAHPDLYPRYKGETLRVARVPRQDVPPTDVEMYEFIRLEWLKLHEVCAWARRHDCLVFPTYG